MKAKPAHFLWLLLFSVLSVAPSKANNTPLKQGDTIQKAWFSKPTSIYRHFVLGEAYEYQRLNVETKTGKTYSYTLEGEVFEDRKPRLIDLYQNGENWVLVVASSPKSGARMVIFGIDSIENEAYDLNHLNAKVNKKQIFKIISQTKPIGRAYRWLNPVGAVDSDGQKPLELLAVIKPHLSGELTLYEFQGVEMKEIARKNGFSNHKIGEADLDKHQCISKDGTQVWLASLNFAKSFLVSFKNRKIQAIAKPYQACGLEQ